MITPTIFIVDDSDMDVALIMRALKQQGLDRRVARATDGADALAQLQDKSVPKPFIMLLDIHMPNKNGYEVLEEIRDNPTLEASQIIVFTGSKVDQILCEPYGDIIAGFAEKQDQDEELTDLMRLIKLQLAILK